MTWTASEDIIHNGRSSSYFVKNMKKSFNQNHNFSRFDFPLILLANMW